MNLSQDMKADTHVRLAQLRAAEADYLLVLESDPNPLYSYYASVIRNITSAVAHTEWAKEKR